MVAPTMWPTFEHVAFNEGLVYADFFERAKDDDDEESVSTHVFEAGRAITYRGFREAVNIAPLRLRIARDFLEIRVPEHALAFARKWGPFSVPDPRGDPRGKPMAFGALETLFDSVSDERDHFEWIDELTAVLGQADAIRDVRDSLESADEAERSTSDNGLLEVIRTMGLAFEPGGSLDAQLVPGHIVQLTAVVLSSKPGASFVCNARTGPRAAASATSRAAMAAAAASRSTAPQSAPRGLSPRQAIGVDGRGGRMHESRKVRCVLALLSRLSDNRTSKKQGYTTMAHEIGKRIKELRELRGIGQQELADAIAMLDDDVTIARDKIGKIEIGERNVSAIELGYLADALGVAPSALTRPVSEGVLFRNGAPTDAAGVAAVRFFEEYVQNARAVELVKRSMPSAAAG